MWRKLLKRAHPDSGGEHELFIWTTALHQHHCHDGMEDVRTNHERRRPPPRPKSSAGDRIDFSRAFTVAHDFDELTERAMEFAETCPEPYCTLLYLLADCRAVGEADAPLYRAQHQGASYRQLAHVGHLCGMSNRERVTWYQIAETIPLAQRHAGHLISKLKREAA